MVVMTEVTNLAGSIGEYRINLPRVIDNRNGLGGPARRGREA